MARAMIIAHAQVGLVLGLTAILSGLLVSALIFWYKKINFGLQLLLFMLGLISYALPWDSLPTLLNNRVDAFLFAFLSPVLASWGILGLFIIISA